MHADIKPDNIMKNSDNKYVLVDWGLSFKINELKKDAYDNYLLPGSLFYASPIIWIITQKDLPLYRQMVSNTSFFKKIKDCLDTILETDHRISFDKYVDLFNQVYRGYNARTVQYNSQ